MVAVLPACGEKVPEGRMRGCEKYGLARRAGTAARPHGSGAPMRAPVQARLRSSFHPGPTGGAAFVAEPWLALEHAWGW